MRTNYFWFLLHFGFSELARWLKPKTIPYIHAVLGILFLGINYGHYVVAILFLKTLTFCGLMRWAHKHYVMFFAAAWIYVINITKQNTIQDQISSYLELNEQQMYEISIMMAWTLLKCISFSMDFTKIGSKDAVTDSQPIDNFKLINCLAYVFYLPNLVFGPILLFKRYTGILSEDNLQKHSKLNDLLVRVKAVIKQLIRIGFWIAFTDFALHFLYITNITYNINVRAVKII